MQTRVTRTLGPRSTHKAGMRRHSLRQVRYHQLSRIERTHAESLTRSCRLSSSENGSSRDLANRSLLQSVMTSIPLLAADFFTLWGLLFATTALVERLCGLPHNLVTFETAVVASLLLVPISQLAGLYPALGTSAAVEFRQLVQSAGTALCIFSGIGIVANPGSGPYFIAASLLTLLLAVPSLPAARFTARCIASKCSWWGAPVLIYAPADVATDLYRRLTLMEERGLRPVAVLLSRTDYWTNASRLEKQGIRTFEAQDALNCAVRFKATWVLIGGDEQWIESAEINAIPNRVLLSTQGLDFGMWDRPQTIGAVCGLWLSNQRHGTSQEYVKRAVDVVTTLLIMLLASPLLLGIAAAIRLSSPGPILYFQNRIGRNGRTFPLWKFRSMVPDADRLLQQCLDNNPEMRHEWETTHKLKRDPRVTWIGRLLRATSLDELPQLWNVLRGEMSLVGPRPIVNSSTYDAIYIKEYRNEYATYTTVRPGLTGLWQVTCRNNGVYEKRIYWDMYYIRNMSVWLDLYIILRTIRTVILREGAS